MIGHRMPQFTLAEGLEVEIDAAGVQDQDVTTGGYLRVVTRS